MGRRALLLANRKARQGQQLLEDAVKRLRDAGLELIEEPTDNPGRLSDAVRRNRDRAELVIVAGGDGTVNAALEGLVEAQLPVGIVPLGTANDLARTLNLPLDLPGACAVIAAGHGRRIDLGWVNGKHYCNVASIGLTVAITRRLSREVKSRWGVLAYPLAAARVVWKARPFRAEIRYADQSLRVRTAQIAVGNGRYYGGGLAVAEDAAIDDRRLDLYSLSVKHWWQVVRLLPALRRGALRGRPDVLTLSGEEFEVHTRRPYRVTTDGEITTRTPAHFRLVAQALTVLAPPDNPTP